MTANRSVLEESVDAKGRQLEIIDLPDCAAVLATDLARKSEGSFCNSYVNFYLVNNRGLVAPCFGAPEEDENARAILQEAFPDRRVVMVDISAIACGGGGIHCITQQQPKVKEGCSTDDVIVIART
jgi:agmatine deiminase